MKILNILLLIEICVVFGQNDFFLNGRLLNISRSNKTYRSYNFCLAELCIPILSAFINFFNEKVLSLLIEVLGISLYNETSSVCKR